MGSMISFELARLLRMEHRPGPAQLFVSGRRAPQVPNTDPPTYNMNEGDFLQEIRRIKGTPQEVLNNPELVQMIVPILRADIEICESYEYVPEAPLDCPILAVGGLEDNEETRDKLQAWMEQTTSSFSLRMLPGDHFFIHTSDQLLLRTLSRELHQLAMSSL
jgi:medium-chain acyl-[acyl-carrier-protein] hydrolase